MACASALFVAAIDFGTTYSGYAFSSKADFDKDPSKINSNIWNAGARSLLSHKAPTAILLNPDKSLNSFGYTAENNYCTLIEDEEDFEAHYFFHRFKMILHQNKDLKRYTTLKDETGKSLPAKLVFSLAIGYLKGHLFKSITDKIPEIREDDIRYVLTVPAIWNDNAKQFMREAAKEAGIRESQLSIALEPEAASIFCQNLPLERAGAGSDSFLTSVKSETKYMVCDLGGGTADITVHQRQPDGSLRELLPASGGAWGGKAVDDAFTTFMNEICGEENIKALRKESMEDYIDLFREFETKKRSITTEKQGKTNITMPVTLLDIMKKDEVRKDFGQAVKQSKYGEHLQFNKQKLQITNAAFRLLFKDTIEKIIDHVKHILQKPDFSSLRNILMVGGFSECELVQTAFKSAFNNKRIVVPDEAGMAVLKGAVLFGHIPKAISTRVARFTYGIQSWPEFDPRRHPLSKKVMVQGTARCKDAFFKYVEMEQAVSPGHRESQVFQALKPDENALECMIYKSSRHNPMFIDEEGCERLGVLSVPLDKNRHGPIEVEETLVFGDTELHFQAKDMTTGRLYEATFDLL